MSPERKETVKPSVEIWLLTDDHYLSDAFIKAAPQVKVFDPLSTDKQTIIPDIIFLTPNHTQNYDYLDLLAKLRERFPKSYRIVLAAYTTPEEAVAVLRQNSSEKKDRLGHDYQPYSYEPRKLAEILKGALAEQKNVLQKNLSSPTS